MESRPEVIKPCGIEPGMVALGDFWFILPEGAKIVALSEDSEGNTSRHEFVTLKETSFQMTQDTPVRGLTVQPRCVLMGLASASSDQSTQVEKS